MELILIAFAATACLMVNLYGRVNKLERRLKDEGAVRVAAETNQTNQAVSSISAQQTIISPQLLTYITEQLKHTISRDSIEQSLIANGWHALDIEKAFNAIQQQNIPQEVGSVHVDQSETFSTWLKEDWMLKLGGFFLIIGLGWFLSVTYILIGPMGRIAVGIIAGAVCIVLGYWRIKNYINQGGIFLVLGSTIILLTIFSARSLYDFFTPLSALAIMFLSVVLVAIASVKYSSRSLALLSLVLASIVPFLTNAETNHVGLFTYLFVVVLGAIWVVALTGQRSLTVAALIIVALYSVPHFLYPYEFPLVNLNTLLLFAYAFAAVFFITNTAGLLKLKDEEIIPDLMTAAGNGILLLVWIMQVAPKEWQSLIISAWMLIFIFGAFLIFKITQKKEPFYVYAGVGAMMLAAATSVELSGAALTIAYTIEVVAASLVTYLVLNDRKISEQVSLLLAAPILFSINNMNAYASTWSNGVLHKDFFVLLILSLTLFGLGIFFSKLAKEAGEEVSQTSALSLVMGSAYAYILLWLSLHAGLNDQNIATIISLAIYTIIGITFYFTGIKNENKGLRTYGSILVGLVTARLLLVDVWNMGAVSAFAMFFIIGALLVATAFLGKKKKLES